MIGETIGHYRVREKIGVGGMGVVYRAEDVRLGRSVALKVLSRDKQQDEPARGRMRREARTLSQLNHPNVQTVHDYHTEGDVECIISEFIAGVSVDEMIASEELPEERVVELGLQLACGLAAAHDAGIVHRDISPTNLRITLDGRLKILDFGIARSKNRQLLAASRLTDTVDIAEVVSGTVPYMAPEQLRGEEPSPAGDVYSAGAVLYEMATGERPFPEAQFADLVDSILHRAPPNARLLNGSLSAPFARVLSRALAKDPKRRFADGSELAAAFKALASESRPGRRLLPRFALWSLAAAVLSAIGGFVWSQNDSFSLGSLFSLESGPRIGSVAVLPLENLSGVEGNDYVAEAMTDAVITELAALGKFRVASRTSTRAQGTGFRSLKEIAKSLGVDTILEGSIRVSGGRVIVNARLVDVATDRHVWVGSYEHDIHDLPSQGGVAHTIADDIREWLSNPAVQDRCSTMVSGDLAHRCRDNSC